MGLLGGGGSILTVPVLVYVTGLDPQDAVSTSLVVVGVASGMAVIPHARAGRVRWPIGMQFVITGALGAFAGGRASPQLPDSVLLAGFAVVMVAAAMAMLRSRSPATPDGDAAPPVAARSLAIGAAVGFLTGLLGAGGGFLIVPALTILAGLSIRQAVGTSTFVIAANCAAGWLGHVPAGRIDWQITALVAAAAVFGSVIGGRLHGRCQPAVLRQAFGWLVLSVGSVLLLAQVHAGVTAPSAGGDAGTRSRGDSISGAPETGG
jgi:uncharacterized membrane protein YfcA